MQPISIRYAFRPIRRSLATGQVADLFGLSAKEKDHVIADNVTLDVRPGDLVLLTGASGSGKSSLLRAVGDQLGAFDAMSLQLPERTLIDALPGTIAERLSLLASSGLSDARWLLRTPNELSEGQRFRFRLAEAIVKAAGSEGFVAIDEFAANLDRTLAKVIAFNLRKLLTRTGIGMLLATTHDDLLADLRPDLHVHCHGDGHIHQARDESTKEPRSISFAHELRMEEGTCADWAHLAKWHYRSHRLAFVRRIVLLKHGVERIGVCVFTAPAASLRLRTRYFGLKAPRSRLALVALNDQLWLLSRVVLHPSYRGAGIATKFVRESCESCPASWIETLSAMSHANPLFERAGFERVGVVRAPVSKRYGGQFTNPANCGRQTIEKSRYSEPMYYVFDNRQRRIS